MDAPPAREVCCERQNQLKAIRGNIVITEEGERKVRLICFSLSLSVLA